MTLWKDFAKRISNGGKEIEIALIGKYTDLKDSYKSLNEALIHGGLYNGVKVKPIELFLLLIGSKKLK